MVAHPPLENRSPQLLLTFRHPECVEEGEVEIDDLAFCERRNVDWNSPVGEGGTYGTSSFLFAGRWQFRFYGRFAQGVDVFLDLGLVG